MENLHLKMTSSTPEVSFNYHTGVLEIKGSSTHESAFKFYDILIEWLDAYCKTPKDNTYLNIQLDYFNTGSSAFIVRILKKMENLVSDGKKVEIKWFYDENDDSMLQSGEDFSMTLKVPMKIVAINLAS